MRTLFFIGCAILGICGCSSASVQSSPASRQAFDTIFEDVFEHYDLPGLALGVIQDGEVIYRRTAGKARVDTGEPITPDTLFKIASNSKAMTTALLARLVDRGKLRWDDPVVKYLPQFKMSDPWITREMQVRDLLIHNSGLREGAGDLMLWPEPNAYTRADIIAGLAHLKPEKSFRSAYAYDNLLYVVAGEVAAAAGGAPYETLIHRELFEPLGMTRCQGREFRLADIGNVAQPHTRSGGRNVLIRTDDAVVPTTTSMAAGGIRCSLNDMLTWIRMWLDEEMRVGTDSFGAPEPAVQTGSWLSRERREELWRAHMPMPISARQKRWDGSRFNAYGYGWRLSDVDGVLRVAHTGTLAGMYSAVTLLPEKKVGFVFLINGDAGRARTVLNQALTKHFTNPAERRTVRNYDAELAAEAAAVPTESRAPDTSARVPLDPRRFGDRAGLYEDPWFGRVSICPRDRTVEFAAVKSPRLTGTLMQVGERILVDWEDPSVDAEAWLHFDSGTPALTMTKVDPDADFSYDYEDLAFERVGACP
jgi:CubicO group peptidase (beta-lactamase class C family)